MSHRLFWFAALSMVMVVAGLGLYVWAKQSPEAKPTVRLESEVFARPADEALHVDLALPTQGDGPFPAVVCLHGGGWVGGSRTQMARTIETLAKRGYVAVAPDYRLAPKHPFPACVEDCKAAVRWLRANAGRYRIDPNRIGAVGLSAGGHLACLLAVTEPGDGLDGTGGNGDRSSAVQAVVAFAAPTDLTDEGMWKEPTLTKNLLPLLGGPPREKMDLYRKASPMSYSPRTPAPLLLVHGADDPVVPVRQARSMAERLNRNGGEASLVVLEGQGHTWQGEALLVSIDKMLNHLDETLKK